MNEKTDTTKTLCKKPLFWAAISILFVAVFLVVMFTLNIWNPKVDVHSSPKTLANAYMDALEKRDIELMNSFMLPEKSSKFASDLEYGKQIWSTVKVNNIKFVDKYESKSFACYQYTIDLADAGISAFSKGTNSRWLYMQNVGGKWYVEGLMCGGNSEKEWKY